MVPFKVPVADPRGGGGVNGQLPTHPRPRDTFYDLLKLRDLCKYGIFHFHFFFRGLGFEPPRTHGLDLPLKYTVFLFHCYS